MRVLVYFPILLFICATSQAQTAKEFLEKGKYSLENGLWSQAEVYFSESIKLEKTAEAYFGRAKANEQLNKATQFCDDLRVAACAESAEAHQVFIQKCGSADTAFVDANFQVCEKEKSVYIRIQYSTSYPSEAMSKYYTRDWKTYKFDWPKDAPYTVVEEQPEFPGGLGALMKYMHTNVNMPNSVREGKVQGKVHLKFVINELGYVQDVEVLKSLSEDCDAEAVRVVKLMPKWKPGLQSGRPVRVYYNLPINFKCSK